MEIYGSARTVLCWNDSAASVGASGRLIRREPACDLKTRRRNWLTGPVVPPEGISPFAGPPWTTTYNAAGNARECRCRRAQEIFCAWRGITPRPRVLPYQLVGGKRPAGSPAER